MVSDPRSGTTRRIALVLGLSALLTALFFMDLALGSVRIPLFDILRILAGGQASRASWTKIVMLFRLPKAITACLAGAALWGRVRRYRSEKTRRLLAGLAPEEQETLLALLERALEAAEQDPQRG